MRIEDVEFGSEDDINDSKSNCTLTLVYECEESDEQWKAIMKMSLEAYMVDFNFTREKEYEHLNTFMERLAERDLYLAYRLEKLIDDAYPALKE